MKESYLMEKLLPILACCFLKQCTMHIVIDEDLRLIDEDF